MRSTTPADFQEEMLKRADRLARTRGAYTDGGMHDWEWQFKTEAISVSVLEINGRISVSLPRYAKRGYWLIYYEGWRQSEAIYQPELYETAVLVMRRLMLLEDLSDV